jgi:hypothetical protein
LKKLHEAGEELYAAFQQQLARTEDATSDIITQAEAAIAVCLENLSQLKLLVQQHGFADAADEIRFFKTVKPRFLSCLIYHTAVFRIHSHWPEGSEIIQREYIEREIARVEQFFSDNQPFLGYYQSYSDYLDDKYFIRGINNIRLKPDSFYFEADPTFSTGYDYLLSQILANNRLLVYLEKLLQASPKHELLYSQNGALLSIPWKFTKADAVEMIYGLHCIGLADLKTIATLFEQFFQIDLGNYYNIFREICLRKKGQTKFLDYLKTTLQRKIDDSI